MFSLSDLEYPIVQAPMAGGTSTPELAEAVSEAGGLGFLAAGYIPASALGEQIAALREKTSGPFGVNVFAPPGSPADPAEVERFAERLRAGGEVELAEPRHDDDGYIEKLELLAELRVPLVSFTFGCPSRSDTDLLRAAGCATWITVTTPAEAQLAVAAGADGLIVQGVEAGGHRGSFDDLDPGTFGLLALLRLVASETDLPLIAAGGLVDRPGVQAVITAGASAVQLGTAFMLCPEAGTTPAHRALLQTSAPTALTRVFTGRTGRSIVNGLMLEYGADAPSAYPEIHHLTKPMRGAAKSADDTDGFQVWAGQAHARARAIPAADLVRDLGQAIPAAPAQAQADRSEGISWTSK